MTFCYKKGDRLSECLISLWTESDYGSSQQFAFKWSILNTSMTPYYFLPESLANLWRQERKSLPDKVRYIPLGNKNGLLSPGETQVNTKHWENSERWSVLTSFKFHHDTWKRSLSTTFVGSQTINWYNNHTMGISLQFWVHSIRFRRCIFVIWKSSWQNDLV